MKKIMAGGTHTSGTRRGAALKYAHLYTPAARPKMSPYVFYGIFVANKKLKWYISK
jgi:hypothetical protein